jgi:protein tyrosine/serine phosphatase
MSKTNEKTTRDRDLPNFHKVSENLYRGGQPSDEGIKKLAEMGIKTVISFRDRQSKVLREKKAAQENGLHFINLRLSNWFASRDDEIHKIIEIIRDPAHHPVFIHCKRGADRTGTVVAVYRMLHEGWTDKQANREAKLRGIGWWQVWMKDYIKAYYKRMTAKIEEKQ